MADDRETTPTVEVRPPAMIGDADRLHQIAVNLIANAVKFIPAGGADTIRTGYVPGGGARFTVTLSAPPPV